MKLTKKLLCLGFLLVLVLVPLLTAYGVLTNPTGWSAQENAPSRASRRFLPPRSGRATPPHRPKVF